MVQHSMRTCMCHEHRHLAYNSHASCSMLYMCCGSRDIRGMVQGGICRIPYSSQDHVRSVVCTGTSTLLATLYCAEDKYC